MEYKVLDIVIPCYKISKLQLNSLFENLKQIAYPENKINISLVEVGSKAKPLIVQYFSVNYLYSSKRIGYAEAANLAIKKSRSKYILLINPDIKIDQDLVSIMIDYLEQNPDVGVVGPKVFTFSNPQEISHFDIPGINFNKILGIISKVAPSYINQLKEPLEVDWVSGCAMFFTKRVWEKVNGFNEHFFLYWEDADFCMRIKSTGQKVVLLPKAIIWHKGSESVGKDNPEKVYYIVRNSLYFIDKYSGILGKARLHIINFCIIFAKFLRFTFQPHKATESKAYLSGILDFYQGKIGRRKKS